MPTLSVTVSASRRLTCLQMQTINGRDVIDATVNINVDEATGQILSYGDASHVDRCAELEHRFTRTAEAAIERASARVGGLVMQATPGAAAASAEDTFAAIMTEHAEQDMADLAACVSPFVARAGVADVRHDEIVDPRRAMIRFLAQTDGVNLLSADADIDALVDAITIEHSFQPEGSAAENRITLLNVPGAEAPVPARLAYVRDPETQKLALVWRFEYQSRDNHYEAGVAAQGEDGRTLYAVDWVRDLLPPTPGAAPFVRRADDEVEPTKVKTPSHEIETDPHKVRRAQWRESDSRRPRTESITGAATIPPAAAASSSRIRPTTRPRPPAGTASPSRPAGPVARARPTGSRSPAGRTRR